ncbi:hydroxymethylglutaryl-CoA lyase [Psychrobacillus sp. OK032]|uniref:hydroxymethylglutaryl-CoA lyase n=1 Tax=Psychrobacillus sp. OK032 TaxID=1884358 RepID=UPI0008C5AB0D|nr:hydroxymethylglutaryl-CoA lyase [Psychrobacillus sp. OK032]SES34779.1 hydroxymethylglutaryl-CoA lyase [Psychrobacillus sp. OK032]
MKLPNEIKIIEIGPRDGLQNEKLFLATKHKIALIKHLVESGFKEIEATSFVHPQWIPNLADAEEVMEGIRDLPATFFALVPNERGYNRAVKSGVDGITFVLSATDSHSKKNLNRTTFDSIKEIATLVEEAKKDGLQYRASVSTVFGCPFEGNPGFNRIREITEQLVKIGFQRIGFCDTIGIANPVQVYEWMSALLEEFKDIEFELHFHDTYGRGLSNVLAGIQAGVYSYDSSIGGLGGCPYAPGATGNISTEDLVSLLHEMNIETGINTDNLANTSKILHSFLNRDLDSKIWRVAKSNS